jgi:hypothetical protein
MAEARVLAPFTATGKQAELARHWHDPHARIVTIAGAIRSGKSQGVRSPTGSCAVIPGRSECGS